MMAVHVVFVVWTKDERCLRMKKQSTSYEKTAANLFLLRLVERAVAVQSGKSPKPVPLAISQACRRRISEGSQGHQPRETFPLREEEAVQPPRAKYQIQSVGCYLGI